MITFLKFLEKYEPNAYMHEKGTDLKLDTDAKGLHTHLGTSKGKKGNETRVGVSRNVRDPNDLMKTLSKFKQS